MSSSQKHKTGIPVLKITPRNGCGDGDVPIAARSQTVVVVESQQQQQGRSISVLSRNQPSQKREDVNPTTHHVKLRTTKKNQGPETWADEVIQSQSQKLRNSSLSESRRRHDDMEKQLHEAEAQVVTMGKLLEKQTKLMNEAAEEAAKKTAELEQKLINQDGHLIRQGTDPVTGMQITLDEEGDKKVETTKKFTKKRVQEMRARLQEMNNRADSYLSDIENTLQFLNGLEVAIDRAGQPLGDILQRFDKNDYEDDKKPSDQNPHQQTGSGINSAIRSILGEKKMQFGNYNVNFCVSDEDNNTKFLQIEGQCQIEHVDTADDESAVEENIP